MGRQKNVPTKKTHKDTEYWNIHSNSFLPVIKKRKIQTRSKPKGINILLANANNKRFYLGNIIIGTTSNIFPDNYKKCKLTFLPPSEEKECESLVIECEGSVTVLVKITFDASLLKEICLMSFLAFNFQTRNEEVYMEIYFQNLPLPKFYPKLGNCIKTLFRLLYNVEPVTARETAPSKFDKNLHGTMEISKFYKDIITFRGNEFESHNNQNIQHPCLKPILRLYQIQAVKWMLFREKSSETSSEVLHPLFMTIVLKSGLSVYYNKYTGYVDVEKPLVPPSSKGGILADEMGLGKTVEVLACILLNKKKANNISFQFNSADEIKSPVVDKQLKRRKIVEEESHSSEYVQKPKRIRVPSDWVKSPSKKTPTRIALEMWYNSMLSEVSVNSNRHVYRDEDEPLIQCICGNTSEEGIIECDSCGKYQHRLCLGYDNKLLGKYLCPQCWLVEPLLECGATLIVTPMALRTQWCNEICRHVKSGLRVLQYEGYSATPVYPTRLKDYDLVITTYNVLKAELRLTQCGQIVNLRRERKYSPPGSPLIRVNWWRLCLDEAQTVETPSRMVSEMAKKITAVHRWAVTGTPISKEVSDLQGLIEYLEITPFNDFDTWKHLLYDPFLNGNSAPMLSFLSQVLWRSSKDDVLDQINIPKQTFKEHFLEFSAVEKYFYRREHELSCDDFLYKVGKFDPSLPLWKMDKSSLKKILAPLLTLRHACTHPNTLRGRYLATKKQVTTMKDLLDALILKNTSDSEECLRLVIGSLNGLAGIHLLLQDQQSAIKYYREVLQLAARYSEDSKEAKLVVDKLQIIHTMYNLANVLDTCKPNEPTLRDSSLKKDCADLEEKYIEKFRKETLSAFETSNAATSQVETLQDKFVLKYGQWYSDGLDWTFINNLHNDLHERIQNACDNANVECNLRSASEHNIIKLKLVLKWDEDVTYLRDLVSESISLLYDYQPQSESKILIKNGIVNKAMNCHLRPQKKSKNSTKCPLCVCNDKLKQYEGKLFHMTQRKKGFEEMSLVGSWKPTLEEVILKSLLGLLKVKNGETNLIKDGEVHINLIEALKKEFKEIRRLWTYLDQQICAKDEVDICKVTLQLKDPDCKDVEKKTDKILKSLTYTVENKNETVNLISVYELDYQKSSLNNEYKINMKKLEKFLGTQSYLETLRKQQYEGQSPDPCPICKNTLENHWSILLCGHSYCLECIQLLLEQNVGEHIQCSVCRNRQKYQEISYIKAGNSVTNEDCIKIKGNYSTKIEAVIKLLLELKSEDPTVKVLLFSSWTSVLKCLKEALEMNSISYEMASSSNLETRIENFKDATKKITTFLLPIGLGSKGLNLIEATHVILVEPLLNPADELQAIGRIHRIGQTKATTVHRFLIKNTIEESIYQATTSNADIWDKNKVTLQQLTELFLANEEVVTGLSDAEQSQNATENQSTEEDSSAEMSEVDIV